ncbi:hypothetical protein D3C80_1344000 [compost metagenome]
MRRGDIADIRHPRIRLALKDAWRRRHAPGQARHFAPVIGVAHHGRWPVGENIERWLKIAEVVAERLRQRAQGFLVGRNVVKITHKGLISSRRR